MYAHMFVHVQLFLFSFSEKFAEVLQKQQNERLERNRERIRMMNACMCHGVRSTKVP